jgi:hypothetical protein
MYSPKARLINEDNAHDGCADGTTVQLSRPLGSRPVVDDTAGAASPTLQSNEPPAGSGQRRPLLPVAASEATYNIRALSCIPVGSLADRLVKG